MLLFVDFCDEKKLTFVGKKCNIFSINKKGVITIKKNYYSVQKWLPFEKILDDGTIKLKDSSFVRIIKIVPINFNLKSNLEKEAILNSYKIFLKTCSFNIQILIQSNKENLSEHISKIEKENLEKNNENIFNYSKKYINFIQELNSKKTSSSKNFYIIIKENFPKNKKEILEAEYEKIIINNLIEKYIKIKDCLSRCGNTVNIIEDKKEITEIFQSFLNSRKYLKY